MSGKDGERFDGLLLSMAHDCSDGGVQEMIDLIFRYQGYTYCRVVTTLVFMYHNAQLKLSSSPAFWPGRLTFTRRDLKMVKPRNSSRMPLQNMLPLLRRRLPRGRPG